MKISSPMSTKEDVPYVALLVVEAA